jgi:hypothetical protein
MAEVRRATGPGGLTTPEPPTSARVGAGPAAVAITAPAACYFTTTGTVQLSTGAAANAAAVVDGWALKDTPAGEMVTLYNDVTVDYNASVTPGTHYYLSGTNAGELADAASTGGTTVIARGVPDNSLTGTRRHRLRVKRSY